MKKLPKELAEIEKDCLKLKREKDLTEFGRGQLYIINIIKNYIKLNKARQLKRIIWV